MYRQVSDVNDPILEGLIPEDLLAQLREELLILDEILEPLDIELVRTTHTFALPLPWNKLSLSHFLARAPLSRPSLLPSLRPSLLPFLLSSLPRFRSHFRLLSLNPIS